MTTGPCGAGSAATIVLAGALAWSSPEAGGAQTSAWLDVPPPPALSLPPQLGVLADERFSAPAAVVPPGEARHTELEGARVLGWLEQIVGFSHASRASGELM